MELHYGGGGIWGPNVYGTFQTKCLKLTIKCSPSFNIGIKLTEFGVVDLLVTCQGFSDSGVLGLIKLYFPIYIHVICESCMVLRVGIKPSDPKERSSGQGKQGVK